MLYTCTLLFVLFCSLTFPVRHFSRWADDETSADERSSDEIRDRLVQECRTRDLCVKLERIAVQPSTSDGQSSSCANPTENGDLKTTRQVAPANIDETTSNEEPMGTNDDRTDEDEKPLVIDETLPEEDKGANSNKDNLSEVEVEATEDVGEKALEGEPMVIVNTKTSQIDPKTSHANQILAEAESTSHEEDKNNNNSEKKDATSNLDKTTFLKETLKSSQAGSNGMAPDEEVMSEGDDSRKSVEKTFASIEDVTANGEGVGEELESNEVATTTTSAFATSNVTSPKRRKLIGDDTDAGPSKRQKTDCDVPEEPITLEEVASTSGDVAMPSHHEDTMTSNKEALGVKPIKSHLEDTNASLVGTSIASLANSTTDGATVTLDDAVDEGPTENVEEVLTFEDDLMLQVNNDAAANDGGDPELLFEDSLAALANAVENNANEDVPMREGVNLPDDKNCVLC
jgi:hypothetical protein